MKEKAVTFTKGKSKFLQNQRGEGVFSVENLGLFFQSSGNLKQEVISCSQIAEHFRTYGQKK